MPIELPVVISQSARGSDANRELEESLVAELVVVEGADVRLIGALDSLDPGSTDQLMLEGLGGDFAMIGYSPAAESLARLRALGIEGRRAAHQGDPNPEPEQGRRIYFVEANEQTSIQSIIALLRKASDDRKTKPISIGSIQPPSKPKLPVVTPSPATAQAPAPVPHDHDITDDEDDLLESLVNDLDELDL